MHFNFQIIQTIMSGLKISGGTNVTFLVGLVTSVADSLYQFCVFWCFCYTFNLASRFIRKIRLRIFLYMLSTTFFLLLLIGGPSGSGKTSLAQKMANIIGCEVVSLESYYKPEQVRDYKYDDYSSLDIALLTKVIYTFHFLC